MINNVKKALLTSLFAFNVFAGFSQLKENTNTFNPLPFSMVEEYYETNYHFGKIPKIEDLVIKEKIPLEKREYDRLINGFSTNVLEISDKKIKNFTRKISPNLASLFTYNISTNDDQRLRINYIQGCGSGFYITENGFLLTAYHVPKTNQGLVALSFHNDNPVLHSLKVLSYSFKRDIALCKINEDVKIKDFYPISIRAGPLPSRESVIGINLQYDIEFHQQKILELQFVEDYEEKWVTEPYMHKPVFIGYLINKGPSIFSRENDNRYLLPWVGKVRSTSSNGPNDRLTQFSKEILTTERNVVEYATPITGKNEPGNSGSANFDVCRNLMGITILGNTNKNYGHIVPASTIRDLLIQYQEKSK